MTLATRPNPGDYEQQHLRMLSDIQDSAEAAGIRFTLTWDGTIHDRSVWADNGWLILLGRGLDIFQKGTGGPFNLATRHQSFRRVVAFGVTYVHEGG